MSKAGKKLIEAAKELLEGVKCEHDWRGLGVHVEEEKLINITERCEKCGMRRTTFS